MEGIKEDE